MESIEELEREAQRAEITGLAKLLKISSTELATAAGVAASTLNRFLNSGDAKHLLTARTLLKVRSAAERRVREMSPGDADAVSRLVQTPVAMNERERECLAGFRQAERAVQDSALRVLGRGTAAERPPPGERRATYAPTQVETGRASRRQIRGAGD